MNAEFESNNVVLLAKRIYQWLNDNENDGKSLCALHRRHGSDHSWWHLVWNLEGLLGRANETCHPSVRHE